MVNHQKELIPIIDERGYVIDEELATVLFLMLKLEKPLLLEGNPGVGKTRIAYILSDLMDFPLIRLQCYEGLDVNNAIYEWNYQRQLLQIRLAEAQGAAQQADIFSREFHIERPLLQAIADHHTQSPILLIDELDRADEEFEAVGDEGVRVVAPRQR